ncbi:PTS sugar transporter [Paenibacillus beijingensis]|uniref:PTS sugar transporter n=1 Tax=Paenibacillus beijingensis TaxID=1126833 RepID=A0A0D5NRA7_9BACL|nr:PTS sugar transporter [Paenibacillus beijingensis]AJY77532.1 PTS sugar transporter [Paenibacillus beijingensis]
MTKKVAVLGSSGGNLFHSGGSDPVSLLREIQTQCRAADITVQAVQFIAAEGSMDHLKGSTPAAMYGWNAASEGFERLAGGTLAEINREAAALDEEIARMIEEGEIDGLILMSADPSGANRRAVEAAARRQLPVVGTGGTSMATVKSKGANVIAFSGTTGTTNLTRAVSYAMALSRYWKLPYRMASGDGGIGGSSGSGWKRVKISGIMTSSMPAFIAVLVIMSLAKLPFLSGLQDAVLILSALPPVILAALAARKVADLGEVTLIAGVTAGLLSVPGGIIGAIIAGLAAGWLAPWTFRLCTQRNFPATTVNITAGALSGLAPGLLILFALGPLTTAAANGIRQALEALLQLNPAVIGLGFGLLMWPAIMRGWYHATVLPLILLEMEKEGNSFFGALDMAGLVMVSAGILLARIAFPAAPEERKPLLRPLWMNIGFGTFIEASYRYMKENKFVQAGAIVSSGLVGMIAGQFGLKSTAYVPSYAALLLSNDAPRFLLAMAVGLLGGFIAASAANLAQRRNMFTLTTDKKEGSG